MDLDDDFDAEEAASRDLGGTFGLDQDEDHPIQSDPASSDRQEPEDVIQLHLDSSVVSYSPVPLSFTSEQVSGLLQQAAAVVLPQVLGAFQSIIMTPQYRRLSSDLHLDRSRSPFFVDDQIPIEVFRRPMCPRLPSFSSMPSMHGEEFLRQQLQTSQEQVTALQLTIQDLRIQLSQATELGQASSSQEVELAQLRRSIKHRVDAFSIKLRKVEQSKADQAEQARKEAIQHAVKDMEVQDMLRAALVKISSMTAQLLDLQVFQSQNASFQQLFSSTVGEYIHKGIQEMLIEARSLWSRHRTKIDGKIMERLTFLQSRWPDLYHYMDSLETKHSIDPKHLHVIVVRDRDVLKSYSERISAWKSILTDEQRQVVGMAFNRCVICGEADHFSRWCPLASVPK